MFTNSIMQHTLYFYDFILKIVVYSKFTINHTWMYVSNKLELHSWACSVEMKSIVEGIVADFEQTLLILGCRSHCCQPLVALLLLDRFVIVLDQQAYWVSESSIEQTTMFVKFVLFGVFRSFWTEGFRKRPNQKRQSVLKF